jgi:thymidylate synthase (FAD)
MNVEYVDHMGSDLTVVNAARVSFNKHKETFDEKDAKLIRYLASHGHWTPFGHATVTLRINAPVPIRTQCYKHKVGFIENEVSRRYTDEDVEFYMPDGWRKKPKNGAKQGSSEETVESISFYGGNSDSVTDLVTEHYEYSLDLFNAMIAAEICVEQARFVLPQGMMCKWYWTGSLASFARFYKQRSDAHAQKEIQNLAKMVGEVIQPLFPISWEVLTET